MYERWSGLFEPETFYAVEPPAGDSPADDRRAYLREFLALGMEGHRTRVLQDRYLGLEASIQVTVGGEELPYRSLPIEIRREPDRERRAALEAARVAVVTERLGPILEQGLRASHDLAEELLGLPYDAYCANLARLEFDALLARTEAFLAETRDAHEELLRYFARRVLAGVPREDLRTHDLGRIMYGAEYRGLFPEGGMVDRLSGIVGEMGLDPLAGGRVLLDLEERPRKSPRAFCAAIRVPDEVRLVLRPHGGLDDYATFLHELGHALHFAHVDPELPVEFRRLGDNGVTEGYAFTFDHLMLVPGFLREVAGLADPSDFLLFAGFRELVMVRRYAAKFAYELSLHRHGPGPARAREYAERLGEATGVRTPEELYLEDVDPHFYCVRYLRAWMLTGALHSALRERFDADWYRNPRTGPFLADLWALGQARPVEALARERLGLEELDFDPLLGMLHERIG